MQFYDTQLSISDSHYGCPEQWEFLAPNFATRRFSDKFPNSPKLRGHTLPGTVPLTRVRVLRNKNSSLLTHASTTSLFCSCLHSISCLRNTECQLKSSTWYKQQFRNEHYTKCKSMAAWISVSLALSQAPVYTARPRTRDLMRRTVCLFTPQLLLVFNCASLCRDGQAELTWVAGYIARWLICLQTVSDSSNNRAR